MLFCFFLFFFFFWGGGGGLGFLVFIVFRFSFLLGIFKFSPKT